MNTNQLETKIAITRFTDRGVNKGSSNYKEYYVLEELQKDGTKSIEAAVYMHNPSDDTYLANLKTLRDNDPRKSDDIHELSLRRSSLMISQLKNGNAEYMEILLLDLITNFLHSNAIMFIETRSEKDEEIVKNMGAKFAAEVMPGHCVYFLILENMAPIKDETFKKMLHIQYDSRYLSSLQIKRVFPLSVSEAAYNLF